MKLGGILPLMIFTSMLFTQMSEVVGQTTKLYVNVPEENLRDAASGQKIGSLLNGTEMLVLVEKDNWVKVQVTGWIWKPSLTSVRKSAPASQYRALHIMVKTRAEADEIKKQLAAGSDFSELAKTKSIAPSAPIGGDLGYFDKGDFNPLFENAIISLQIDQVSGIIEAGGTFNIFKRIK